MLRELHRSKESQTRLAQTQSAVYPDREGQGLCDPSQRKMDTRRKIQLGGLIIKAGLASEEPAVLLGMLTAAAQVLNAPNAMESRRHWKELGARAFGSGTKH